MPHRLLAPIFALFLALPAQAQVGPDFNRLVDALALDDVVEVMRAEGLVSGEELGETMLGRANGEWARTLERIYALDRLQGMMRSELAEALGTTDLAPLLAFFTSDRGREIIALELSARQALLDEAVEEASRAVLEEPSEAQRARLEIIERFVAANALVDTNVVGALNSNYAFYRGLAEGGAATADLSEGEMLAQVWGQEAEIRAETEEWLYSYLLLAYEPLSDADLEAYIAISETNEGQALNQALFDAFDVMFVEISKALGLAVSRVMMSQEL